VIWREKEEKNKQFGTFNIHNPSVLRALSIPSQNLEDSYAPQPNPANLSLPFSPPFVFHIRKNGT
jgi:hypothetical protein